MTEPTFDADGYPTEECLKTIREWPDNDPLGWFEFIEEAWWAADWGWKKEPLWTGSAA